MAPPATPLAHCAPHNFQVQVLTIMDKRIITLAGMPEQPGQTQIRTAARWSFRALAPSATSVAGLAGAVQHRGGGCHCCSRHGHRNFGTWHMHRGLPPLYGLAKASQPHMGSVGIWGLMQRSTAMQSCPGRQPALGLALSHIMPCSGQERTPGGAGAVCAVAKKRPAGSGRNLKALGALARVQ